MTKITKTDLKARCAPDWARCAKHSRAHWSQGAVRPQEGAVRPAPVPGVFSAGQSRGATPFHPRCGIYSVKPKTHVLRLYELTTLYQTLSKVLKSIKMGFVIPKTFYKCGFDLRSFYLKLWTTHRKEILNFK
jgi:hypothetical protein